MASLSSEVKAEAAETRMAAQRDMRLKTISAWLEAQLASLTVEDQAAFGALSCNPALLDKGRSLAIWVTNALPADDDDDDMGACSAVYRVACRTNHACVPSCAHAWSRSRQQLTLHAVRPIAAGEELTINYLGGGGASRGRDERQAALFALGFHCACPTCALPPPARAESDARRARMASLSGLLAHEKRAGGTHSYEECEGALEELLGLMRLEGIAEAWAHADVAALMAKAWATGHKEACASWGERWVASMTILVGDAASVKETLGVDAGRPQPQASASSCSQDLPADVGVD